MPCILRFPCTEEADGLPDAAPDGAGRIPYRRGADQRPVGSATRSLPGQRPPMKAFTFAATSYSRPSADSAQPSQLLYLEMLAHRSHPLTGDLL